MARRGTWLVLLGALWMASGCGGGGDGDRLTGLVIYPGSFAARTGDSVDLGAVGSYSSGADRDVSRQVTWHSTDSAVASVSPTGRLDARTAGQTQISARLGAVSSAAIAVTVQSVPAPLTADYFPLQIGNQWEYTGTVVSPSAVGSAQEQITASLTVTRQAVVDGSVWYEVMVRGSNPQDPPTPRYMRHDPQGLVQTQPALNGGGYVVSRLLDSSLTPSATWPDPEDPDRQFTIESTTEFVDVPAGSFTDCVMVVETDSQEPDLQTISWYRAGMGMVQWQVYDRQTHSAVHEQRLVRAHFGAK